MMSACKENICLFFVATFLGALIAGVLMQTCLAQAVFAGSVSMNISFMWTTYRKVARERPSEGRNGKAAAL